MDHHQFDQWTRTRFASRRTLTRLLPASLLGPLFPGLGDTAYAKCVKPGKKCDRRDPKRDTCCQNGKCRNGRCRCKGKGKCRGGAFDAKCRCRCPEEQLLCGGRCRDISTDPNNCNECGRRCPAGGPLTRPVCGAGRCDLACRDDCTTDDGECADLANDRLNCGICRNNCDACLAPKVPACVEGECRCLGTLPPGEICPANDPEVCLSGACDCRPLGEIGDVEICLCR